MGRVICFSLCASPFYSFFSPFPYQNSLTINKRTRAQLNAVIHDFRQAYLRNISRISKILIIDILFTTTRKKTAIWYQTCDFFPKFDYRTQSAVSLTATAPQKRPPHRSCGGKVPSLSGIWKTIDQKINYILSPIITIQTLIINW